MALDPQVISNAVNDAHVKFSTAEGGANARKVFLLNSYLARVRRGRQRDVS